LLLWEPAFLNDGFFDLAAVINLGVGGQAQDRDQQLDTSQRIRYALYRQLLG
jgi:hypothetical protein